MIHGGNRDNDMKSTEQDQVSIQVSVHQMDNARDLPLPEYKTPDSAGLDLHAAIPADSPLEIRPGSWTLAPTGLKVAIPRGYEGQIRPRSGLAARHGIGILNSPGTIDSDYRGEIRIILFNFSGDPYTIRRGDRIAQIVICKVEQIPWLPVPELTGTKRGEGGFGHTGR